MEEEKVYPLSDYRAFAGVKFESNSRCYFFGVKKEDFYNVDDFVIVETARGIELGQIAMKPVSIKRYDSELGLKPIVRLATEEDLKTYENNKKDAEIAAKICKEEVERLALDMNLTNCEYTLDKAKVIISYLADDRVDFRELLKVLASKLKTRIELRQIGSRDKAKMVGGIGLCGLPLCCATFLNEFDGISISRAKNQMLAINIPKLSGHCGKLICCLKFEDDFYTEAKKEYPELGSKVWIDKKEYVVTNINVISTIIKIEGPEDDIQFIPLEDFNKVVYRPRKKEDRNAKK